MLRLVWVIRGSEDIRVVWGVKKNQPSASTVCVGASALTVPCQRANVDIGGLTRVCIHGSTLVFSSNVYEAGPTETHSVCGAGVCDHRTHRIQEIPRFCHGSVDDGGGYRRG